ncbi:MAG: ylaC [Thermoleophilia bacterium]|nr:ylaC [Thermoleophilia bacterium]
MTHLMTSASDLPPPTLCWVDDDVAVLRAAASGDVPAQERLWRTHLDAVHRVCASQLRQHDAEDAVADTFLVAFEVGASFDPARGSVRAWLLGIAVNQVRRRWRVDRRIASTLARVQGRERRDAATDDHADRVIARADAGGVRHALERLSDADRLVLVAQAAGDLLPLELAEVLGVTPGAAKVRLHRARSRLAALLAATSD